MAYRRFGLAVAARVTCLTATALASAWVWAGAGLPYTAALLAATVGLQAWALWRRVARTNRDMAAFLEGVMNEEFAHNLGSDARDAGFGELRQSMDRIARHFRDIKIHNEEQHLLHQAVIQHAGIGLVAYAVGTGKLVLANAAAKRMLRLRGASADLAQWRADNPAIARTLEEMGDGERRLAPSQIDGQACQIALHVREIHQRQGVIKLVSAQNIQAELEEKEMESWQKLTRVLTHEIMNSITPITSLTETLRSMLSPDETLDKETANDIRLAINTIHKRGKGLLSFVETYRNLTRVPAPSLATVRVASFIGAIAKLFEAELRVKDIELEIDLQDPGQEATLDEAMMETVLVNLMKNAIEAVEKTPRPRVALRCRQTRNGGAELQVADNGMGILPEVMDRIFVPFFTTRPDGTGIGLALCRQMVRAQGGAIYATSGEGETVFTIRL